MSDSVQPRGLDSPWDSPGQNMGVGSLSLLQGIFPTQGSNPGLPHCRRVLYQLDHKGSPMLQAASCNLIIKKVLSCSSAQSHPWNDFEQVSYWLLFSHSVKSDSLQPHGGYPARFLCPWDFPGKNTGVGCLFLLQGIFLTQESNPHLLLGRWILYSWATWEALSEYILGFCFFPDSTFLPPLLAPSYFGGGQDRRTPYLSSCLNRLQGMRRGASVPSTCNLHPWAPVISTLIL